MKKIILIAVSLYCLFISSAKSQIQMNSNGIIGVGINPQGNSRFAVKDGIYCIDQLSVGASSSWTEGLWCIDDAYFWKGVNFYNTNYYMNKAYKGNFGSALNFDFNPNITYDGIILEQGYSESSGFYSDGDYAVIWSPGDYDRLLRIYDEDGMVEKFYIDGNGYMYEGSDIRRKENIKNLNNNFDKLIQLRGVNFNFKDDTSSSITKNQKDIKTYKLSNGDSIIFNSHFNDTEEQKNNSKKNYYGFIAQEVEKIFPDLVSTNEQGHKFLNYSGFIPIIIESMKEQKKSIEQYETRIEKLEKEIELIQNNCCNTNSSNGSFKTGQINTSTNELAENNSIKLYQNVPNPFSVNTEIKYYLPDSIGKAIIYIYDMNGTQQKSIPLQQKRYGHITINGSELKAGMYMYTLIANGQVIDTKRMILTD